MHNLQTVQRHFSEAIQMLLVTTGLAPYSKPLWVRSEVLSRDLTKLPQLPSQTKWTASALLVPQCPGELNAYKPGFISKYITSSVIISYSHHMTQLHINIHKDCQHKTSACTKKQTLSILYLLKTELI